MMTLKLFLSINVLGYSAVLFTTFFLSKGVNPARIIGWICMTFSLGVFAAPLCILVSEKLVKSDEICKNVHS